jgi:hypothetical protein
MVSACFMIYLKDDESFHVPQAGRALFFDEEIFSKLG